MVIGAAPLDGTGHATLALPVMSAGAHNIMGSYAGDGANFAAASAVYGETVQLRPTSTTMTSAATSSQQVTLIAVVEGQGSVAPGGTVTFAGGGVTLGQSSIGTNGFATVTVSLSQSTQLVTASYAGDVNYSSSQSPAIGIVVEAVAPFTLTASPPAITLVSHQHTTLVVNIGSVKGFTDTIALGCSGLPSSGTCTFTPSQVVLSGGAPLMARSPRTPGCLSCPCRSDLSTTDAREQDLLWYALDGHGYIFSCTAIMFHPQVCTRS